MNCFASERVFKCVASLVIIVEIFVVLITLATEPQTLTARIDDLSSQSTRRRGPVRI